MRELISFEQYLAILDQPILLEEHSTLVGSPYLVVALQGYETEKTHKRLPSCPVIGVTDYAHKLPAKSVVDLCVSQDQVDKLIPNIEAQAGACATLVQLLRHNEQTDLVQGLFAESLAYSTLQQSAGFQSWLASADKPTTKADTDAPIIVAWENTTLNITLNRPAAHNAYSMALKDALCASLESAYAAAEIECVSITGNGPSFCAGGDLSEFGQVTDANTAHMSRTTRGAAALLADLQCRTEVHLHGACIGAGIEIPSFADYVSAKPESFFQLPEIAMGLVPGAGGTAGITRRIGRQRTGFMAISNQRINTATALEWGLIDEIV